MSNENKKDESACGVKEIIITVAAIVAAVGILIMLLPLEKRNFEHKEYGRFAVLADNNEKARYILDHIEEYPMDLVNMYYMANPGYEDVVLDNIYNYAFHKNDYYSMSFSEEELNCESVPQLFMDDFRWCYEKVGDGYICYDGCTAVSLTMANLYLTHNNNANPKIISDMAVESECLGIFGGINSTGVVELCDKLGIKAEIHNYNVDEDGKAIAPEDEQLIKDIIDRKNVVMLGMLGETFGGHAMLVSGYNDSGFIINDPADRVNSTRTWTFEELSPEIKYVWELSSEN